MNSKIILNTLLILCLLFFSACSKKMGIYNKHSNNPMQNHDYDLEEGNYFEAVGEELKNLKINLKDHHYKSMPIKYWVEETDEIWDSQIRDALADFEYFFPMSEVNNKNEANLVIEITDIESLREKYPAIVQEGISGIGGLERVTSNSFNNLNDKTRGVVMLLPHAFKQPLISKAIILHELMHAFGISAHSDDEYDIMYEKTVSQYEIDSDTITVNGIEQDLSDANSLSVRDLNTLWLLYNQW